MKVLSLLSCPLRLPVLLLGGPVLIPCSCTSADGEDAAVHDAVSERLRQQAMEVWTPTLGMLSPKRGEGLSGRR